MRRHIHCWSAVAVVAAVALASSPVEAQDRQFTRTVDLQPSGTLRVEGDKGSIRLSSWDQPQVEIRARIELPDDVPAEYAQQVVDATEIEVTASSGSVSVRSNYDNVPSRTGIGRWGDKTVPAVHYEIRAPRRIDLQVDSDRGPASIRGFEGPLDIVIDRGELDLQDAAGDIRLNIDRGERSTLTNVRGSLTIEADRTDLRIETAALERDSRIEIDRGDVDLRITPDQRLTVRTDLSRRGNFRSDLPIQWMSEDQRRSEGHVNGGGPELYVESDRATIGLRTR
jgi:hypothetical protein